MVCPLFVGNQQRVHRLDGGDPGIIQPKVEAAASKIMKNVFDQYKLTGSIIKTSGGDEDILHAFGDSFAHVDESSGRYYPAGHGHLFDLTTPDDPYHHSSAYKKYATRLYEAGQSITGAPRASSSEIARIMAGLSKLEDKSAQRDYLNGVMSRYGVQIPEPAPEH